MAQVVPDRPSPTGPGAAERRVLERLRDGTLNSLVAFHHVAWLSPAERGPRHGEADFVIADPHAGLIVLELKGGGIRYDAERRMWSSVGRDGPHEIQDPVEQARSSSYILGDALALASGAREDLARRSCRRVPRHIGAR